MAVTGGHPGFSEKGQVIAGLPCQARAPGMSCWPLFAIMARLCFLMHLHGLWQPNTPALSPVMCISNRATIHVDVGFICRLLIPQQLESQSMHDMQSCLEL